MANQSIVVALPQAAIVADLALAFPSLWIRPLSEFSTDYAACDGVWTGGGGGEEMPNGDSIFNNLANGVTPYDGTVHCDFTKWLDARGWFCERYDGDTYFLRPDSALDFLDDYFKAQAPVDVAGGAPF